MSVAVRQSGLLCRNSRMSISSWFSPYCTETASNRAAWYFFVVLYVAQYGQQLHHSFARLKNRTVLIITVCTANVNTARLKSKHQSGTAVPGYTGYTKEDADGSAPSKQKQTRNNASRRRLSSVCTIWWTRRIRTLDLSDANRTLSQLSYRPMSFRLDKCTSFSAKKSRG